MGGSRVFEGGSGPTVSAILLNDVLDAIVKTYTSTETSRITGTFQWKLTWEISHYKTLILKLQ